MAEDYPRTLMDLEQCFSTDEGCAQYLAGLRWPDGFRCPGCGGAQAWRSARGLWVCRDCARHTSVTAGTIFADSNLPLRLWFRAIWQVVTQKDGASALGLQRVLGLGSYRTAWSLLHKLRRAMVRAGRERLRGIVEVDESYLGAPEPGKSGRQPGRKTLIVAARASGLLAAQTLVVEHAPRGRAPQPSGLLSGLCSRFASTVAPRLHAANFSSACSNTLRRLNLIPIGFCTAEKTSNHNRMRPLE